MRKIVLTIILFTLVLIVTSCASSYGIQGSSNISTLDGRKMYLKALKDNDFINVDSCDVVHGRFNFHGTYDSIYMAIMCIENSFVMPIIVEEGKIEVVLNDLEISVKGSEHNDILMEFNKEYEQINAAQNELIHKHDQAILDGQDMNLVIRDLQLEGYMLDMKRDSLLRASISENFDNVVGSTVFFIYTMNFDFPYLNPLVEELMTKATPYFKNNPYVKEFYQKALENQAIMNGLISPKQ